MTPAHSRSAPPCVLANVRTGAAAGVRQPAGRPAGPRATARRHFRHGATQYPPSTVAPLAEVIRADLTRTGQFRLISAAGAGLNVDSAISHDDWRSKGADFLAYGSIVRGADGRYDVRYRLADTVRRVSWTAWRSRHRTGTAPRRPPDRRPHLRKDHRRARRVLHPHRLRAQAGSDLRRRLNQVADADGQNPQVARRSREPIISPSWSPDGSKLAYVSFESGKPVVYVHTLATSARVPVANFKGNNSARAGRPTAPSWPWR